MDVYQDPRFLKIKELLPTAEAKDYWFNLGYTEKIVFMNAHKMMCEGKGAAAAGKYYDDNYKGTAEHPRRTDNNAKFALIEVKTAPNELEFCDAIYRHMSGKKKGE